MLIEPINWFLESEACYVQNILFFSYFSSNPILLFSKCNTIRTAVIRKSVKLSSIFYPDSAANLLCGKNSEKRAIAK